MCEYLKFITLAETYTLAEAFVNSGSGPSNGFRSLCKLLHAPVGMSVTERKQRSAAWHWACIFPSVESKNL